MKKYTSATLNKEIRALEEDKMYLLQLERESSVYILADGEKTPAPEYDYESVQEKIKAIDKKVRKLKHVINQFNINTVLDDIGVTIDEALVEMAQLNKMKDRLDIMRRRLPKKRCSYAYGSSRNVIEYEYVNYDLDKVAAEYTDVSQRITQIQIALDIANQTMVIEVDD